MAPLINRYSTSIVHFLDLGGKNTRVYNISEGLIKPLAKTGVLLHLPLNSERLKRLTESYEISNTKLKTTVGIERIPVSAKDGLVKTLESFGSNAKTLRRKE